LNQTPLGNGRGGEKDCGEGGHEHKGQGAAKDPPATGKWIDTGATGAPTTLGAARTAMLTAVHGLPQSRWTNSLMPAKSIDPSTADFQCDLQKCDEMDEKRDETAAGGRMDPSRRRRARRRMTV
jgi:hypothetical protein